MRLVFVSDTHGMHGRMAHKVPDGDVLVHCGDMTGHGTLLEHTKVAGWLGSFQHTHKLAIAGNHDAAAEQDEDAVRREFSREGVLYLKDTCLDLDGVKFWGAPWTPNFCDWSFMPERLGPELAAKWDLIPEDTEVLITHGPPHGILDAYSEPRYIEKAGQVHVGCELLRARIERLPALRLHAFGHIHEGHGYEEVVLDNGRKVRFVNAAICTRSYTPFNPPIVVDL